MTKILVYVEGGVVQSVLSDNPNIKVEVFDVDNLKTEDISKKDIQKEWGKKAEGMVDIY